MKKTLTFMLSGALLLVLAACGAGGGAAGIGSPETVERFGFRFTVPAVATSHGIEDGTYDIEFGNPNNAEGLLSFSEPEAAPGADSSLLDDPEMVDSMTAISQSSVSFMSDLYDEVGEVATLGGAPAFHYSVSGKASGLPVRYELYIVYDSEQLYSLMAMTYTDDVSDETTAAMDGVLTSLEFIGEDASTA